MIILDDPVIEFPNGWQVTIPWWLLASLAIAAIFALTAVTIRFVVRRINRHDDPRFFKARPDNRS